MEVGSTIPPLAQVIGDWSGFREAFNLRHVLIHGRGTCTRKMAAELPLFGGEFRAESGGAGELGLAWRKGEASRSL